MKSFIIHSAKIIAFALTFLFLPALVYGQQAPAVGTKSAGHSKQSKTVTPVDQVLKMAKAGLSEDMILKAITKESLRADLSSDDMIRLKQAGATDRVISALMDSAPATQASQQAPVPANAPATAAPSPATPPAPAAVAPDPKSQLRRAAIDEFDWASVRTSVEEIFQTNVDIGKGIRSMLTKRLQEAGKIRIMERAKINTVMGEEDFGASNRVKKGTNARIGQILGADVYLMGDIVVFGRDDRDKRIGVGGITNRLGGIGRAIGGLKIGSKEEKAVIVINYRLVDAETGEIMDSGEARGESSRKGKGLGGMFGISSTLIGGSVDMKSSNFAQTIIGEATIAACDKLAESMNAKIPNLPKKQVDVEARVSDLSGSVLTLAAGSNDGVLIGDRFDVFRIVSDYKDPDTGEVLDRQVEKTGDLVITSVRERVASGAYTGAIVTSKNGLARKIANSKPY
jgi:curli biogenesis system outer membrane secretion channel CsgG